MRECLSRRFENQEDFDGRLENCRQTWIDREAKYLPKGRCSFYDYFMKYYASTIRHCMLKDLRISVGLGSPPAMYSTNSCESLNAVIKRKVDYKESEWPKFNDQMKELVDGQREDAIRALSGRGAYRLCEQYKSFCVPAQRWVKMTPDQRKKLLKKFDSADICASVDSEMGQVDVTHSTLLATDSHMSISFADCGIDSVPQSLLEAIWSKADKYLRSTSDIVPSPGNDPKAMMVASHSAQAPHFVRGLPSGQFVCDDNCLQWKSSHICSHVVAVSEKLGELKAFLKWFIETKQQPNITSLAFHGLPAGRGRKGGVPRRKRARSTTPCSISMCRPATSAPIHPQGESSTSQDCGPPVPDVNMGTGTVVAIHCQHTLLHVQHSLLPMCLLLGLL